jgi:cell shape-determining protein MreD
MEMTTPRHAPNWMLMIVCLVAAITASWEALHIHGSLTDLIGYLALGVGMLLFAVEAVVDAQFQMWIERTQVPAVLLTIVGVILLCLST